MNLNEKIKRIIEQRQAEAVTKNISKKLSAVASAYGYEVMSHESTGKGLDGFSFDSNGSLEDLMYGNEDDELPTMEHGGAVVARNFDGLSMGINMQIFWTGKDLLKATYDGNLVYKEELGQLTCYIPHEKWENDLNMLYKRSLKIVRKRKKESEAEAKELSKGKIRQIMDYLNETWGV